MSADLLDRPGLGDCERCVVIGRQARMATKVVECGPGGDLYVCETCWEELYGQDLA